MLPVLEETSSPVPATPEKIDWLTLPEVEVLTAAAIAQARADAEVRRWNEGLGLLRTLGLGLAAAALMVLCFELTHRLVNDAPSAERMAGVGTRVTQELLRVYDTPAQPLQVDGFEAELIARDGAREADYRLLVTLRLRAPLYAPAESNGAQPYLALQRSVNDAYELVVRDRLYLDFPDLATPPPLPALLARTHRTGEKLILSVPLAATRSWWGWRLEPRLDRSRVTTARFTGQVLQRLTPPYLIFGTAEARDAMRGAARLGREYILDVRTALAAPRRNGEMLSVLSR